ncbi:hypothetical protein WMF30_23835 [Sorangium sp. So ce134]
MRRCTPLITWPASCWSLHTLAGRRRLSMASSAADIITQIVDPSVFPSTTSRVVDIQPDPRGGYFALVDVSPAPREASPGCLLKFDDAHKLVASWIFSVGSPVELYNVMRVAAMSVGPDGIYIVGTASLAYGGVPDRAFVLKLSLDARRQWARIYLPLLVNGCRVPYDFHTAGRGIARLPAPDGDRLLVVFQTSVLSDSTGSPPSDDAVGAMVFTIDGDGNASSDVTRIFGRGQLSPVRLRVLPSFGPTIVGRTRVAHPKPEPWMPFLARVDRDGNIVAQHAYEVPDHDAVFNDIAEDAGQTLAVGLLEPAKGPKMALAMNIDVSGRPLWSAQYGPPVGDEFFSSELNVVQALGGELIAGGSVDHTAGHARPWLVRLQAAAPDPIWRKRYEVNSLSALVVSAFHALLLNMPNRVIAGGNILRRQLIGPMAVTDRVPFFAVSRTEPDADEPGCSVIDETATQPLNPRQTSGSNWMDRMRTIYQDWSIGVVQLDLPLTPVCPSQTPP